MGTSPSFRALPGSPLSTGCSEVNSRGERSQDHRLHNASDCWLLMLRLVLRGKRKAVYVLEFVVCVGFFFSICTFKLMRVSEDMCMFLDMHHLQKEDLKKGKLICWTTIADETWWTAVFLSSCWWGFECLSLRGGIQFPPPPQPGLFGQQCLRLKSLRNTPKSWLGRWGLICRVAKPLWGLSTCNRF